MNGRWCIRFLRPIISSGESSVHYIEYFAVLKEEELCKARQEASARIDKIEEENREEGAKNPMLPTGTDLSVKNFRLFLRPFRREVAV